MTLKEKIEVMEAFERGEEIQVDKGRYACWALTKEPSWNWSENNYRIKPKPKQTVVIEKWLVTSGKRFDVAETSDIDAYLGEGVGWRIVKLLKTYEVEI